MTGTRQRRAPADRRDRRRWPALVCAMATALVAGACATSPPAGSPATAPAGQVAGHGAGAVAGQVTGHGAGPVAAGAAVVGVGIPWAVGLPTRSGVHDPGEWPPFPVPALRLWDSRTTWRDLQPAPGTYDFGTLDAILRKAAARGTSDITLVLAGTPEWASVRTTADDAPWIGPGSASPPRDLREWSAFVSAVAERYRGRIAAYEIGNEPNLRTFWNGTPGEWAAYVAVAAAAVRAADPAATVVADVGLVRRERDLRTVAVYAATAAVSPDVDVLAVHAYPTRGARSATPGLLARARAVLDAADPRRRPTWLTEVNVSGGSALPAASQAATVRGLTRAAVDAGYARVYWYAWTALGPADLIQLSPGTPGAVALEQVSRRPRLRP